MSKRKKRNKGRGQPTPQTPTPETLYREASRLADGGDRGRARLAYAEAEKTASPALKALIQNDLGVLAALDGDEIEARRRFEAALALDPGCCLARQNLDLLVEPSPARPATTATPHGDRVKVAILSLLFNWPTTGGGNVHTAELALFLGRAGYDVRHFFAHYPPWGVGEVADTPFPAERLSFHEGDWTVAAIQARFRQAVASFSPDHVIVTDSWNMKPLLAEAIQDFSVILRLQAMECLCPLNNVRLLAEPGGGVRQCPKHQLATYDDCARCVTERGHQSGDLHRAERALSGVGTAEYQRKLLGALRAATAVLVVNPLSEALVSPYATDVRVVTAGMDPARFPWPAPRTVQTTPRRILFAGLVHEWMKGYHLLHSTCARLWGKRQDFELLATGDPPGRVDAFTRFVGWLSQEELPRAMYQADLLVVPALSQEALGRTAVEAMAAGLPVVASRLGGLPATVADGATGLLFEPGNEADLGRKLETILDDPELGRRMGLAGRRRFEEHYDWNVIVERHYVPLLGPPRKAGRAGVAAQDESRAGGLARLSRAHPWPERRPELATPPTSPGWLEDGARELLAGELSASSRLVVEVGAWLGMSTRFIADHAPQATVVTIDHWEGSPEHKRNPAWRAMLPTLFQDFLSLCWDYRARVVPVRRTSADGLREVAAHGLSPDLIYLDCDHTYEATRADLELAGQLFPDAILVGDDYDEPGVCDAVTGFAQRNRLRVVTAGQSWRAWKLSKEGAQR